MIDMLPNTGEKSIDIKQSLMNAQKLSITDEQFSLLAQYTQRNFGLDLGKKRALVQSRLGSHLLSGGFSDYGEYIDYLYGDRTGKEASRVADLLTTNYSYFMREWAHFDFFKNRVLPELKGRIRDNDLRTWSAGCASGQEPYTLAMLIADFTAAERLGWDAKVLATDIAEEALGDAAGGVYDDECMDDVPRPWKFSYFDRLPDGRWAVKDTLKKEVIFARFNLMEKQFPFKRGFHAIFCRNVMIYFNKQTRNELVRRFYNALAPGGYLFIGQSESLYSGSAGFRYIQPSVYRKDA